MYKYILYFTYINQEEIISHPNLKISAGEYCAYGLCVQVPMYKHKYIYIYILYIHIYTYTS